MPDFLGVQIRDEIKGLMCDFLNTTIYLCRKKEPEGASYVMYDVAKFICLLGLS